MLVLPSTDTSIVWRKNQPKNKRIKRILVVDDEYDITLATRLDLDYTRK